MFKLLFMVSLISTSIMAHAQIGKDCAFNGLQPSQITKVCWYHDQNYRLFVTLQHRSGKVISLQEVSSRGDNYVMQLDPASARMFRAQHFNILNRTEYAGDDTNVDILQGLKGSPLQFQVEGNPRQAAY